MKGRPFAKVLNQHWTYKHGKMVAKKQFKTLDEVLEYMTTHHINQEKYHPYICRECYLWHIGHYTKKNN